MTTTEIIETLIDSGIKAYKHNSAGSVIASKLDRHETVVIDGIEFSYWREFGTYKTAEYIKEIEPEVVIELILDGNNSCINITMADDEQKRINQKLYTVLKKAHKL